VRVLRKIGTDVERASGADWVGRAEGTGRAEGAGRGDGLGEADNLRGEGEILGDARMGAAMGGVSGKVKLMK
jgi:hypothetical protein